MSSEAGTVVGAVALPGRAGRATVAPAGPAASAAPRSGSLDAAVLMAAAAGLAHLISTPTHFRWWQASGVFFAAVTAAQLGLALALYFRRTGTLTLLAGLWSNVAVVSVYVASRLTALPGQPVATAHGAPRVPGRAFLPPAPEGVGPFDMFALVVELALVVVLLGLLPAVWRRRTSTGLMWVGVAMCTFAAWAIMSSGVMA